MKPRYVRYQRRSYLVASRAEAWIETIQIRSDWHDIGSPPARRRGLKPKYDTTPQGISTVASRAEAWIETDIEYPLPAVHGVASRAEAWIETPSIWVAYIADLVASRAEAWIETYQARCMFRRSMSPPARRRGLKQV